LGALEKQFWSGFFKDVFIELFERVSQVLVSANMREAEDPKDAGETDDVRQKTQDLDLA